MIRAVVFDLYGTLLSGDIYINVEDKNEGLSRILREAEHDVYYQEVWAARQFVMFIDYPKGRTNTPQEFYAKVLKRLEIPADSKLAEALASKATQLEKVRLYQDVAPTINALKARGIKTAILTDANIVTDLSLRNKEFQLRLNSDENSFNKEFPVLNKL